MKLPKGSQRFAVTSLVVFAVLVMSFSWALARADIPVDTAIESTLNSPFNTTLYPGGDVDYYKFDATPGDYSFETFSDIDTYLYLYWPDGVTEITRNDDSGEDVNALITWTCMCPGIYYLKVRGYDEYETGEYSIVWLNITGNPNTTITGYIYYNNEPFPHQNTTITGENPHWDSIDVVYDNQTGMYTTSNDIHGEYYFEVFVDASEPYGTGEGYGGDYFGYSYVYIPFGSTELNANISVTQIIHLISPVDNHEEIGSSYYDIDELTQNELIIEWESLPEASSYSVSVSLYNESNYYLESVYSETFTNNSVKLNLPVNEVGEYYRLYLYAYNEDSERIGRLYTAYPTGSRSRYMFKIVPRSTNIVELQLYEGWNIIGLPLTPVDSSIEVILAPIIDNVIVVWTFDGETKIWSSYSPVAPSDLTEMHLGQGYWINVNTDCILTLYP